MVGGINITLANVIVALVMFAMIVGVGITIGRHDRRSGGPERRASERAARITSDASGQPERRTPWDDGTAAGAANANAPARKGAAATKPDTASGKAKSDAGAATNAAPGKKTVPAKSGNRKR